MDILTGKKEVDIKAVEKQI